MNFSKIACALLLVITLQTQHSKPVTIPAGLNFTTFVSIVGAGTTLKMTWHNRNNKSFIGISTLIIMTDIFSAYLSQGRFNTSQKVTLPIMLNCLSAATSGFFAWVFLAQGPHRMNMTAYLRAGCSAAQTALCAHRILQLIRR